MQQTLNKLLARSQREGWPLRKTVRFYVELAHRLTDRRLVATNNPEYRLWGRI